MQLLTENDFGQIHQVELSQGFAALVIAHPQVKAKISLYGGQVLNWQPAGEKEIFWLSKTATFTQGKAIRGGIPLCWPWFGVHPEDGDNQFGNHGFAREQTWQFSNAVISEQGVEIRLTWQGANMNELWPYPCQLEQVLFFGSTFKQTLNMKNTGDTDAFYTGALHSYFAVSSPENIKIAALEQASFSDKLTGKLCQPECFKNGVGPVDRVYHTDKVMTIVDSQWNRTIQIKATNCKQWVFWNPGVELANNMSDIHQQGEQEFVCLEAANTNMQPILAGENVKIEQEISVFSDK